MFAARDPFSLEPPDVVLESCLPAPARHFAREALMPRRFYQHICKDHDLRMINWTPCNVCGAPGVYAGWEYSGIESMGHYKRLYGLPPMGPHRPFVDWLRLAECCIACDGKGLLDIDNGRDYVSCAVCDGIGRRLVCPPQDLNAVQQIAWLVIDQHKQKPWLAGDGRQPVDRVLGLIADESARIAARRLLDQQRFPEVVHILAWQGVTAPNSLRSAERHLGGKDQDEEEISFDDETDNAGPGLAWDNGADGDNRRPSPPSAEDISRLLEQLGQLNLLNDE